MEDIGYVISLVSRTVTVSDVAPATATLTGGSCCCRVLCIPGGGTCCGGGGGG